MNTDPAMCVICAAAIIVGVPIMFLDWFFLNGGIWISIGWFFSTMIPWMFTTSDGLACGIGITIGTVIFLLTKD